MTMNGSAIPKTPPFDDALVDQLVEMREGRTFECKRLIGEKLTRALESVVAFANTEGGILVLGLEDEDKATGRDRVYGIQESLSAVDELQRLIDSRITPLLDKPAFMEIGCTLRDGSRGSLVVVRVEKSETIHSIVLNGTWQRLNKGNKELVAEEIAKLSLERGSLTAEGRPADVDFQLLQTQFWQMFASARRLTRPLPEALQHIGLAKKNAEGLLQPTWAAVLLFSEEPSGLLRTKASIRIFHYKAEKVDYSATPNLVKPPKTISGPLIAQIADAYRVVLDELASGVQMGPLGFEIVQKYPTRVIKEAITNAVIHRDYSIPTDIQIRIFSDRIEISSPGMLPGRVTVRNIQSLGSFSRNPLIVSNLREFPDPPNLDAGEGVRMMFQTMNTAGLYPPLYFTRTTTARDEVLVVLLNENRPSTWDQVSVYLEKNRTIGNAEVRRIMKSGDTLSASKLLKRWVERGLLQIENPTEGKRVRRYELAEVETSGQLFSLVQGKQSKGKS